MVGRFLNTAGIFYFANGRDNELYYAVPTGAAQSFERYGCFPIRDAQIRHRIRNEILAAYMADTAKSRIETAEGAYPRVRAPEGKSFSAQDFLIRVAEGRDSIDNIPQPAWQPEASVPVLTPRKIQSSGKTPSSQSSPGRILSRPVSESPA